MLNDAHCHFFSTAFFSTLSRQRGRGDSVPQLCGELQWDDPGTPEALADRWVRELDANGVGRAALIASVPGDEASVAAAIANHSTRFVGFFMLDPSASDAAERPLAGLQATARLLHPTDTRADQLVVLTEQSAGQFQGRSAPLVGQWMLVVELSRDGARLFRSRNRVFLR